MSATALHPHAGRSRASAADRHICHLMHFQRNCASQEGHAGSYYCSGARSACCSQAMQDKVQALVRLSEAERAQSRSVNSIDSLKKQNQDLTHRLTLATQEKVNALLQLAADGNSSHGAASGKGGVPSPQKASTWKVQFTRVHCFFWPAPLCCAVWWSAFAVATFCCAALYWPGLYCTVLVKVESMPHDFCCVRKLGLCCTVLCC